MARRTHLGSMEIAFQWASDNQDLPRALVLKYGCSLSRKSKHYILDPVQLFRANCRPNLDVRDVGCNYISHPAKGWVSEVSEAGLRHFPATRS